jgi:hypothetical protein
LSSATACDDGATKEAPHAAHPARRHHHPHPSGKAQLWVAEAEHGQFSTLLETSTNEPKGSYTPRWPGLVRFLADSKIPLDTNSVERALRGVAVGRKNHYGSRSERGTRVAALFYSLIESSKLCGVEPRAYLREATLRAVRAPGTATLARDLKSPRS